MVWPSSCRAWAELCLLQGVRTLVASNEQPSDAQVEEGRAFNETWTWWPDDVPQRSMCALLQILKDN